MIWAKPMGAMTAPLVFLGLAIFLILFNVFGSDSALARKLLAHFSAAAPGHLAPRPLLPLRLAETFWLLAFGGGAVWLQRFGLVWSGLALILLLVVTGATWALSLWLARMSLRLAFADSLPHASIK